MEHWYVVQTKPRKEEQAAEQLSRQGYEVYLPRIRLKKRYKVGWKEVLEALFPRYLFIRVDPAMVSIAPVRSTIGVTDFVRFGGVIGEVPDSVIAYIRESENPQTGVIDADTPLFSPGDRVEIVDGPFAGMPAIFKQEEGRLRVSILIDMLGRQSTVIVSKNALNKPNQ